MPVQERELFVFCRTRIDLNDTTVIVQEFDESGMHRLVWEMLPQSTDWVSYRSISALDIPNVGQFRGTSEYYSSVLPRVFQLINKLDIPA